MSRIMKWGLGAATIGFALAMTPAHAVADEAQAVIMPAVVRTTGDQATSVPVQTVRWHRGWGRRGFGIGVYRGGWGFPGVGVYVGPRYHARRYFAPRYYGGYYQGYPTYRHYGYTYPSYGYYGYAPYGNGWYGW